jgi:hypothetical protein
MRRPREVVFLDRAQQIGEGGKGQLRLCLCRATRENPKAILLAATHPFTPNRRLSDPRLTLEHECDVAVPGLGEEPLDLLERVISSDDRIHAPSLVDHLHVCQRR